MSDARDGLFLVRGTRGLMATFRHAQSRIFESRREPISRKRTVCVSYLGRRQQTQHTLKNHRRCLVVCLTHKVSAKDKECQQHTIASDGRDNGKLYPKQNKSCNNLGIVRVIDGRYCNSGSAAQSDGWTSVANKRQRDSFERTATIANGLTMFNGQPRSSHVFHSAVKKE